MSPEIQIIFVFGVFLGLLVLGMSVPFAIAVPSLVYVFLQTGVNGFKALGVVSWGSTASFVLTAIPLFLLMAEIMQRSGLTTRIYTSLAKLVSLLPGRLLQTRATESPERRPRARNARARRLPRSLSSANVRVPVGEMIASSSGTRRA